MLRPHFAFEFLKELSGIKERAKVKPVYVALLVGTFHQFPSRIHRPSSAISQRTLAELVYGLVQPSPRMGFSLRSDHALKDILALQIRAFE